MNWKKRTPMQVDESVNKRDYTGGYEFGPWLIHMRKMYLVGLLGNLAGGLACLSIYMQEGEFVTLGCSIFFGLFAPTLIATLLRKEYKRLKKGQSA